MHITNLISQYFGKFAKTQFPSFIQTIINNGYVKFLGLNMSEFKNPKHYKSLNLLFTRELEIAREINTDENVVISPTDSLITECGAVKDDTALQIKGMEYSVEELLTYHCSSNFDKVTFALFITILLHYSF